MLGRITSKLSAVHNSPTRNYSAGVWYPGSIPLALSLRVRLFIRVNELLVGFLILCRGMQRLVGRHENAVDFSTVQGILEFGIQKVLRIKEACLGTASRTDNGVHAIESAVHFDYKGKCHKLIIENFCDNSKFIWMYLIPSI